VLINGQIAWLFFGLSGRINRPAYFLAGILLYMARAYTVYRIVRATSEEAAAPWGAALILVTLVTIYPHIALAVKRLHDIDRPGWFALLFVVADFFMFAFLCFAPGTPGPNKFGSQTNAPR
jgi:uncharacterized membrane protein YhaH (DUF805 family)